MGTREVKLRISSGSYCGHAWSKMIITIKMNGTFLKMGEDSYAGRAIFSTFFEGRESKMNIHRVSTFHLSQGDCRLLSLINQTDFQTRIGFWRQVGSLTRREIIRRLRLRLPLELLTKKMK